MGARSPSSARARERATRGEETRPSTIRFDSSDPIVAEESGGSAGERKRRRRRRRRESGRRRPSSLPSHNISLGTLRSSAALQVAHVRRLHRVPLQHDLRHVRDVAAADVVLHKDAEHSEGRGSIVQSDDIGVEFKGVRSGVERRRGRALKSRGGRRETPGEKVLKERRSPRRRGRREPA